MAVLLRRLWYKVEGKSKEGSKQMITKQAINNLYKQRVRAIAYDRRREQSKQTVKQVLVDYLQMVDGILRVKGVR